MHLIVVRRDGAEYRICTPSCDADGTWTVPLELAAAGVYRAFADFSVDGEQHDPRPPTSSSPAATFEPRPFPAPAAGRRDRRLRGPPATRGDPAPARRARCTFTVTRGGAPGRGLEPYLGAKGHLVALREGDLAFLHVHPERGPAAAAEIDFERRASRPPAATASSCSSRTTAACTRRRSRSRWRDEPGGRERRSGSSCRSRG